MSEQQELMTDRLVYVISSIQLGRTSGVLTVKRGEGIFLEEGTIVFANGQVSKASAGRRRGSEALNWLSSWGSCRFMFVPTSSEAGVHVDQPSLPAAGSSPGGQEGPRVAGEWEGTGMNGRIDTPASAAPYPTQHLDAALRLIGQYGLGRVHRQLFCLVDGRRTIEDLVRLMGKSESEIYSLLGDLERAHIIRIT